MSTCSKNHFQNKLLLTHFRNKPIMFDSAAQSNTDFYEKDKPQECARLFIALADPSVIFQKKNRNWSIKTTKHKYCNELLNYKMA